MKKQVYVVEGKNDASKLKQVFENINVVSVGGSAIDEDAIKYLKSIENHYEIIICTDPDFPGIQIRNKLETIFPKANHIFIERRIAFSSNKRKIGLEHLNSNQIKELFKNIYIKNENINRYKMSDLYKFNLIGKVNSQKLRNDVAKKLNFGKVNGKTFLRRLNESKYSLEQLIKEGILNES